MALLSPVSHFPIRGGVRVPFGLKSSTVSSHQISSVTGVRVGVEISALKMLRHRPLPQFPLPSSKDMKYQEESLSKNSAAAVNAAVAKKPKKHMISEFKRRMSTSEVQKYQL